MDPKNVRKVKLPTMLRNATVEPASLNVEKRTVDIVWTTKEGSRVLRRRFFSEDFHEELGLEKKHVRMGRLESGTAPFLDQHGYTDKAGVRSAIGVIENADLIEGKEGRATIRFSKRDEVEEIFQDVRDGILSNVSVGYNVYRFMELEETAEDGLKVFRAVDWEPVEISLVTAGADPHAKIRSNENEMADCVVEEKEKETKPETREVEPTEPNKNANPGNEKVAETEKLRDTQSITDGETKMDPKEIEKARQEAVKEATQLEKTRQTEIRSIVRKCGFGEELAQEYIDADKNLDEVRTLVIDAMAERDKKESTVSANPDASVGEDLGRKARLEGMSNAILHRFRPKEIQTRNETGQRMTLPGYELTEVGREFAYLSLAEMARACVEGLGIRTGHMPKHKFIDIALNNTRGGGLHSSSDFPLILEDIVNKTLRGGYQAAPKTWMPFTNEIFVSDFKTISRTNLGDAPKLDKVGEGGEVTSGTVSEAAEKYNVEEFAKRIGLTRKTIVNDDLAAFTRLPERMGRRAADLESDTVWDIIKDNAAMADALALFSAGHGNLSAVPAAPDEAGLNELRASMRRQTGLDGAEISLVPVWVFVPPAHETAMEKLLATTRPNAPSEANPFGPQGRTTLMMDVEPRLETGTNGSLTHWFGTADKGQVDMIELARLEGADGPQIQTRDGFEIAGMEIKISHDIGAKAIDHRGLFKNAGA